MHQGLKNNKCSGTDQLINEYLKHSAGKMMPIYISLFSLIFETGIILVMVRRYNKTNIQTQRGSQTTWKLPVLYDSVMFR